MSDLHEAVFTWSSLDPSDVVLTGTFDGWSCSMRPTKEPAGFVARVRIPWGTRVQYKWIIDGVWMTDSAHATGYDPQGNINNVYDAPPRLSSPTPEAPAAVPAPTPGLASDPHSTGGEVSSSKADINASPKEPPSEPTAPKTQEEPHGDAALPPQSSKDTPAEVKAPAVAVPAPATTTAGTAAPTQAQHTSSPAIEPGATQAQHTSSPAIEPGATQAPHPPAHAKAEDNSSSPPITPTTLVATPVPSAPGTLSKSAQQFPVDGDTGSQHKSTRCEGKKGLLAPLKGNAAAEGGTTSSRKKRHSIFGKLKHLFDHQHHDSHAKEKGKQEQRK